jgi:hypothetical protein
MERAHRQRADFGGAMEDANLEAAQDAEGLLDLDTAEEPGDLYQALVLLLLSLEARELALGKTGSVGERVHQQQIQPLGRSEGMADGQHGTVDGVLVAEGLEELAEVYRREGAGEILDLPGDEAGGGGLDDVVPGAQGGVLEAEPVGWGVGREGGGDELGETPAADELLVGVALFGGGGTGSHGWTWKPEWAISSKLSMALE